MDKGLERSTVQIDRFAKLCSSTVDGIFDVIFIGIFQKQQSRARVFVGVVSWVARWFGGC